MILSRAQARQIGHLGNDPAVSEISISPVNTTGGSTSIRARFFHQSSGWNHVLIDRGGTASREARR